MNVRSTTMWRLTVRITNCVRRRFSTTRVRITVVSVVVVGIALAIGGFVLHASLHANAEQAVRGSAGVQAKWIESLAISGVLPNPLPPVDAARLTLVQVLDGRRHVIAASSQLAGEGDDGDARYETPGRIDSGPPSHAGLKGGPWFVESASADVHHEIVTVVVFTSLSDYEHALDSIDQFLAISLPMLLVLVAAATWFLVGRSLRPVDRMRREVDAISAGNLDSRVVEPSVSDEVGRLALTLNSMLERLQRSSDRQRRFIADASHELRTPVANVAAALDVARRYPDRTDWPEVASDLTAQNQRMARLVDDLLVIARTGQPGVAPQLGAVDLSQLVRDEVRHLGAEAQHLIHLTEPFPDRTIEANAQQLERIIANLLENAARHANNRVDVSIEDDADAIRVTVADDGPGIPVDQRDRVFEPFVRLDEHRARHGGGAGLGLAIVHDLVTAAGGTITLTGGQHGGAVFTVHLPRTLSA